MRTLEWWSQPDSLNRRCHVLIRQDGGATVEIVDGDDQVTDATTLDKFELHSLTCTLTTR